jgi:hypothetical protein
MSHLADELVQDARATTIPVATDRLVCSGVSVSSGLTDLEAL